MQGDDDPRAFVMREVFDGVPVTRVFHEADGDWQYLTDGEVSPAAAQLIPQSHVYETDPSLRELASMPPGTWAVRENRGAPWAFGKDTDEEEDPLVYVMREVFDGVPVTRVFHEADGAWQYLTEAELLPSAAQLAHQSHLYEIDPSLRELAAMPLGTWAVRDEPGARWEFGEIPEEDQDEGDM